MDDHLTASPEHPGRKLITNQIQIRSKDVNGVVSKFNTSWDVTYTSLK